MKKNHTVSFERDNSLFFKELSKRVRSYFRDNNIEYTGNWKLYFKTIILIFLFLVNYCFILFSPAPLWVKNFLCAFLGVNAACIGFNIMHDGAHGSYSKRKWVNQIMAHSLNLVGGFVMYWKSKHNDDHHNFTNVDGIDADINIRPFIRISPNDPKYWHHQFQHHEPFYLSFYCLAYLFWVMYQDFVKYFTIKVKDLKLKSWRSVIRYHVTFWAMKAIYIFVYIILPIITVGLINTIIGYLAFAFTCGLFIAIVFQMAHILPETAFPLPNSENKIEGGWAKHQLKTTANFASDNKILSWFLGGLNYQVEHHLFPWMCHVHYKAIRPIVKDTCKEYGVEYKEHKTFLAAMRAHKAFLKKMGSEKQVVNKAA